MLQQETTKEDLIPAAMTILVSVFVSVLCLVIPFSLPPLDI